MRSILNPHVANRCCPDERYVRLGSGYDAQDAAPIRGIAMGASHDFTLRPVHAHLNLLGWTTLGLAGLIYAVYPQAATTRCARVHFWLFALALPVMMLALTGLLLGQGAALPALVASEFAILGGVLAFALNVFLNLMPRRAASASCLPADCVPAAGRA